MLIKNKIDFPIGEAISTKALIIRLRLDRKINKKVRWTDVKMRCAIESGACEEVSMNCLTL